MRYRNMKTGDERDFVQGMKFDDLWKPVRKMHSEGRSTVTITEIHPEDIKKDMDKTIMGDDKAPEQKSRKKSAMAKAVSKANKKLAAKLAATQEAEVVEESK